MWLLDPEGNALSNPLIDISEEVGNWRDHGLLGFALDPDFRQNGFFYLLYAVDRHHLLFYGTPEYHPDTTNTHQPSIGRVTRYQASFDTGQPITDPSSRTILLGSTKENGFPLIHESHGVGSLVFGNDGTLLISAGEGNSNRGPDVGGEEWGSYVSQALADGTLKEDEDIGLLRSQYLGSLGGKVLRIDPQTGAGLPSNPYYDENDPYASQSLIWALGLRNPYRISLWPNTGSHYPGEGDPGVLIIGDVGGSSWEELNICTTGGQNFGWPFTEGHEIYWGIWNAEIPENPMAPNPVGGGDCPTYFTYKDLFERPDADGKAVFGNPCNPLLSIPDDIPTMIETMPALAWSNSRWNKPERATFPKLDRDGNWQTGTIEDVDSPIAGSNFGGFSSMAGVIYQGDGFPEEYQGKYFQIDYDDWIRVFEFNDQYQVIKVDTFHTYARQIFHLAEHPTDGCLYYLNLGGQIRRICYGGNPKPVIIAEAAPPFGPSPLTVQFDASDSYAPFGHPLSYQWDFGDGTTSTDVSPSHTFSSNTSDPTSRAVQLTVTDSTGTSNTQMLGISLNNTPPQVEITSFQDGDLYPTDQTTALRLAANVMDAEHSEEELTYTWQTFLHHNFHFHPEAPVETPLSFTIISPVGCDGEDFWYRIRLTVEDPAGLETEVEQLIYPRCDDPIAQINPFTASPDEASIPLSWSISANEPITTWELQRSIDRRHYDLVASGDVNGTTTFNWTDDAPINGQGYYRVKVYGEDRSYTYSKVLPVLFPPPADIEVFPNPTVRSFNLAIRSQDTAPIDFRLMDASGKRVGSNQYTHDGTEVFQTEVLIDHLPAGTYLYQIRQGDQEWEGKIVKY